MLNAFVIDDTDTDYPFSCTTLIDLETGSKWISAINGYPTVVNLSGTSTATSPFVGKKYNISNASIVGTLFSVFDALPGTVAGTFSATGGAESTSKFIHISNSQTASSPINANVITVHSGDTANVVKTIPASVSSGQWFKVFNTSTTQSITINLGGYTYKGQAGVTTLTLPPDSQVELIYTGATFIGKVV